VTSTPAPPQVGKQLQELTDPQLEDETEWFDCALSGEVSGEDEVADVAVIGCTMTRLRLAGRVIERLRLVDVELEGCDLSGAVLVEANLTRVRFTDCRLTGAVLSGVKAEDVTLSGCRADGAVLRMSSWKRSAVSDTDLRGADFYDASLPDIALQRCDLTRATFAKARLDGARLHGSTVDAVVGGEAFRGVRIGGPQVLPLALSVFADLGIEIEDEPA
jgi:uncharacterized protein YjbI with pentapeptide repeats